MTKHVVIAKKTTWMWVEIEASSEEEALQIAKDDPDQFDEFGTDECDPQYKFEIQKKYSTGALKP